MQTEFDFAWSQTHNSDLPSPTSASNTCYTSQPSIVTQSCYKNSWVRHIRISHQDLDSGPVQVQSTHFFSAFWSPLFLQLFDNTHQGVENLENSVFTVFVRMEKKMFFPLHQPAHTHCDFACVLNVLELHLSVVLNRLFCCL